MTTTKQVLADLLTLEHLTIQHNSFLEPLDARQSQFFKRVVANLGSCAGEHCDRKANLVFRGEQLKNLARALSTHPSNLDQAKVATLLFYFGQKAKHYYKHEDPRAEKIRWIPNIEDVSQDILETIFMKTRELLGKTYFQKFCRTNKEFVKFFKSDNLEFFCIELWNDQTARDYYLYLLHTAGQAGLGDSSVLISTSLSIDKAFEFTGDDSDGCVFYYVLPEPLENLAVSHLRMTEYEPTLSNRGLPTYKQRALKPHEAEIAIRGALFSSSILGLRIYEGNKFIVNPHLFEGSNNENSIINGLYIDNSEMGGRLSETGYSGGVCTRLDGNFQDVLIV